ncbi:hypothetical protein F5879DRAFT_20414 [Lentinula edodes]|nr:hypothetical protein F5879DRAFT_20414 [Lentinula edodes]
MEEERLGPGGAVAFDCSPLFFPNGTIDLRNLRPALSNIVLDEAGGICGLATIGRSALLSLSISDCISRLFPVDTLVFDCFCTSFLLLLSWCVEEDCTRLAEVDEIAPDIEFPDALITEASSLVKLDDSTGRICLAGIGLPRSFRDGFAGVKEGCFGDDKTAPRIRLRSGNCDTLFRCIWGVCSSDSDSDSVISMTSISF